VNLAHEGISDGVHMVGDVMYDVMLKTASISVGETAVAQRLGLGSRPYVAVTVHRAATTDNPALIAEVFKALGDIASSGFDVVFPVHPRIQSMVDRWEFPKHVQLIEPLGYRDMIALVQGAQAVATDSGGLQKEAAWLGTPCVTLRENTEWVETIAEGWNVLAGTDRRTILEAVISAKPPSQPFVAYGTGDAANTVVELILAQFG
jgi:UDP-GlcNAc3NAcA epimerase